MANMQQFTDNILARKKESFQQDLSVLQEKLTKEQTFFVENLVEQETAKKESIQLQLDSQETQEKQKIDNYYRNELLRAKQDKLNQLFDKAHGTMVNWDQSRMQEFAYAVFKQLDDTKHYTCRFGEATPFVTIEVPNHVTVSDALIPQEAGFILESDGIVYNYLFSTLIDALKRDFMGELAVLIAE